MIENVDSFYVYENVLFTEHQWEKAKGDNNPTYCYLEPTILEINDRVFMVINQDGTCADLVEYENGMLVSISILNDCSFLNDLASVL